MKEIDIWDRNNKVIQNEYCKDNYEVMDYENDSNICMIFFSSNGLYYPNTEEEFLNKIVCENRFEWKNMCKSKQISGQIKRAIFLRDIYKQWYVSGINKDINTTEKLLIFLEELARGYEKITVGSSSGGYIATLAAIHLNAMRCFNISGQFFLCKGYGKFIEEELKGEEQGFGLLERIRGCSVPIYYFCPIDNVGDRQHYDYIRNNESVREFMFAEKAHGSTMLNGNLPYIVSLEEEVLESIYGHYKGRRIGKISFLFYTVKFSMAIKIFSKEILEFLERRRCK